MNKQLNQLLNEWADSMINVHNKYEAMQKGKELIDGYNKIVKVFNYRSDVGCHGKATMSHDVTKDELCGE